MQLRQMVWTPNSVTASSINLEGKEQVMGCLEAKSMVLRTLERPSRVLMDIQDPEVQASFVNLLLNKLG